ncbi:MAG: hypothetical protein QNJ31_01200 [Candidatus Caenarcaniphilales bacterium]|nr:hypothetical protein [Candidatus Caenarcaniphilales bacterium]
MPPSIEQKTLINLLRYGSRSIFKNPHHGDTVINPKLLNILNNTPPPRGWTPLEGVWYESNKSGRGCSTNEDGLTVAHCTNKYFYASGLEEGDYGRIANVDSPVQTKEVEGKKYYRLLRSIFTPKENEICSATKDDQFIAQIKENRNQKDIFLLRGQEETINFQNPDSMVKKVDFSKDALSGHSGMEFQCKNGAHVVLSTSKPGNKKEGTVSY